MKLYINGKNADPFVLPDVKDWLDGKPLTVTTSGTTGHPKTVTHSHEVMRQVVKNNIAHLGHHKKSKLFSILNPRGIGFQSLMVYIALEADCDLYMEEFNPHTYVDRMNAVKPTFTVMAPNLWSTLHKREKWKSLDLSCCETVLMGADFTPSGALDELREHGPDRVVNAYGSTEVPPCVMISENENSYSVDNTLTNMQIKISDRNTLMCKWDAQSEWWDSEDLVSGDLLEFKIKGRERNMFKQDIVHVYPEEAEKLACDYGADIALCRQSGNYADLYFVGNMNQKSVRERLSHVPRLRLRQVREIKVDDNLRKVLRNQELEIANVY